jgi:predicted DCC family thiol-disulfide oxidoreductase YuxK
MDHALRPRLDLRALGLFRIGLALLTFVAVVTAPGAPAVAWRMLAAIALLAVGPGIGTVAITPFAAVCLWLAAFMGVGLPPPLLAWWLWVPLVPWGARASIDAVRRSLAARHEMSADDLNDPAPRAPDERLLGAVPSLVLIGALAVQHLLAGPGLAAFPLRFLLLALLLTLAALAARRIAILITLGALAMRLAAGVDALTACATAAGALFLLGEADFAWLLRLGGRLAAPPTLVYYDSDCGICSLIARILVRLDRLHRLRWVDVGPDAPLPADWTRERLDEVRAHTLITWAPGDADVWTRHRAVGRTLASLPGGRLLAWPFRLPGLDALLGRAYDQVARNRHRISARLGLGVCGLTPPPPPAAAVERPPVPPRVRRAADVALGVVFAAGVAWLATR